MIGPLNLPASMPLFAGASSCTVLVHYQALPISPMQLLQTTWLRTVAEKQFYHEPEQFATADSVNLARLHTFLPGAALLLYWPDGPVLFHRQHTCIVLL